MPSHTGFDLFKVHIVAVQQHLAENAPVAVLFGIIDNHLPYGCHGGLCGVCLSRIIAGRIVYPAGLPPALVDDEAADGHGLCCVGVPASDLVIEPVNAGEDWEPWE